MQNTQHEKTNSLDIETIDCIIFQKEGTMKKFIEIHAAEGGDDSKLFVADLAAAYIKLAGRLG